MAKVQFVFQSKNVKRTAHYKVPKRVTSIDHWFKNCRKAISEIPEIGGEEGWALAEPIISLDFIMFQLSNRIGEKCNIVIDRNASGLA